MMTLQNVYCPANFKICNSLDIYPCLGKFKKKILGLSIYYEVFALICVFSVYFNAYNYITIVQFIYERVKTYVGMSGLC
jgi:hypothetical protein